VASLLASPISWSHHWVWAIPCLGTLAFRTRWWCFGLITAVVAVGPMQFMPKEQLRELHHTHPQQLVANVYALLAVAYLIFAWVRLRHAPERPLTAPAPVAG
jgi:alpha-1,2-mannosyltransferase